MRKELSKKLHDTLDRTNVSKKPYCLDCIHINMNGYCLLNKSPIYVIGVKQPYQCKSKQPEQ